MNEPGRRVENVLCYKKRIQKFVLKLLIKNNEKKEKKWNAPMKLFSFEKVFNTPHAGLTLITFTYNWIFHFAPNLTVRVGIAGRRNRLELIWFSKCDFLWINRINFPQVPKAIVKSKHSFENLFKLFNKKKNVETFETMYYCEQKVLFLNWLDSIDFF